MRCYAERGYATLIRPSVCPSVTFMYADHTANHANNFTGD